MVHAADDITGLGDGWERQRNGLLAAEGVNDQATYNAVFQLLVTSEEGGYNPEQRTAAPFLM